jgi:internalin A
MAKLELRRYIEQAIEQELTELDLNGNQLSELPPEIGQLTSLTGLYLRDNQLNELPPEIGQLTDLTILYLRGNQLSELPPEIGQLTNLAELNLRGNQLGQLPPEIVQLTNLTSLVLSDNQLSELLPEIGQLTNLTRLYLRYNRLGELPPEIVQLTNLTSLDLRGNQFGQLPPEIVQLTNLTSLDLSGNQLSELPPEIGQLTNLTRLNLSRNRLGELPPEIGQLTSLTGLYLHGNQLSELPPEIGQLANLTSFDLRGNQFSELPPEIVQLANLMGLNLSQNPLSELSPEIGQLTNLTMLNLGGNQFSELPPEIGQLTNLTSLFLSGNQLSELPPEIGQLTNLTELYLRDNQFSELPPEIVQLTDLIGLFLRRNQLSELPPEIGQLTNLTTLELSGNQLSELPPEIGQLTNLTTFDLTGNPIEVPPPEVVRQGIQGIRNYFQQLKLAGTDTLYEAKLLIVGEAGAGKTTLAKKINNPDYRLRDEPSTEGIDIIRWQFPMGDGRAFWVNIWDFGGQEIYQATHQFFLTKRSLYLLVADTRKEDTDFYYWLNVVELLSDNSPLLIVKNEKQDRKRDIPERQLRGQFTNLEGTLSTNLATNRGLGEVIDDIKHYMTHLPHIGAELPKTWVNVREALENDPRHYINVEEYLDICEQNGITQLEFKRQLSGYLHDLGVCLHFQDDPLLNKTVILKPSWGTDAVYKVLDTPQVRDNFGRFTLADLDTIWAEEKYALMRAELAQLMMKFQLCYQLPGTAGTYIVPQLLSDDQPEYPWDEANNLILRYSYDFLPKGIITRFIVAMHRYIADQQYVWKSGVILEKDQTRAEVVEYYDKREIKIRVAGQYKRDLMIIVNHELDKIHASLNRLKFARLIPCNCEQCKGSQAPHFYEYESLRIRLANKRYQVECDKSYQLVDVLNLIDDIGEREQLRDEDDHRREGRVTFEKVETVFLHQGDQGEITQGGVVYQQGDQGKITQGDVVVQQSDKGEITVGDSVMAKEPEGKIKSAWANGLFYLLVAVVIIGLLGYFGGSLPFSTLALIIIGGILIIPLVGAFQLRQDDRLSEKNFTELMRLVIGQLPLVGRLARPPSKPDD